MKKTDSQKPVVSLMYTLCFGIVCVSLVSMYLGRVGPPALFVNFTRQAEDSSMPLYFFNVGKDDVYLDVSGMEYFLFYPTSGGNKYILQLRSKPFGVGEYENTQRILAMKKLASKESYQIGDMRSLIAGLPGEGLAVTAVYSALFKKDQRNTAWTGEIRSLPLILTK